jgi:predicted RNase H-like nuclease (RuvC/YqgF family)
MTTKQTPARVMTVALLGIMLGSAGCLSVQGPEEINVSAGNRPRRIESSHVPTTRSHEEARRRLAEAYERNQYLEHKVEKLERENRELKNERDEYKRKYKREKDRNDD